MAAQMWALVGVVAGTLLAGGASLLLAWRQETVQATAGVEVVCDVLRRAEALIRKRLLDPPAESAKAVWWRPDEAAPADSWRAFHGALVSRLAREQVAAIEAAMARLSEFNALAAMKHERHDEQRAAIQDAEVQAALADLSPPPGPSTAGEQHAAAPSAAASGEELVERRGRRAERVGSLAISVEAQQVLNATADEFERVRRDLGDASLAWATQDELIASAPDALKAQAKAELDAGRPLGPEVQRRLRLAASRLRDPRGEERVQRALHRRSQQAVGAAAAVLVAAVATAVWSSVAAEPLSERAQVAERAVAAVVSGETEVDCEPVADRVAHFDCLAVRAPGAERASGGGGLVAQARANRAAGAQVDAVERFLALYGEGQEEVVLTEFGASSGKPSDAASADLKDLRRKETVAVPTN